MNSKINALIIEDEILEQEYLKMILDKTYPQIDIKGCSVSVNDSITLINAHQPELLFMDIELADGKCFKIFDELKKIDFEVIFITGNSNYLQDALNHYAFSFLEKPINIEKLNKALDRYINLKERIFRIEKFQNLSYFLREKNPRILINIGVEHVLINISHILKCEANGNYTNFYLTDNNKPLLASNPLKYYQNLLEEKGFFRLRRSIMINVYHITSIYKRECIILSNGERVFVSKRNKHKLFELMELLS